MERNQSAPGSTASTVLGRRLGGELHRLRTAVGLTQGHAAKALSASTGKVAKMESGSVPIRDPDIRALCDLYEATAPEVVGPLLELARLDRERRKAKGWWHSYPFHGTMKEYVPLEQAATAVKTWQIMYVPGLLQTADYVRAIRKTANRGERHDEDEKFVSGRLERQRLLRGPSPLRLSAVIHEAALRHNLGDEDIMRGQLDHLRRIGREPNVKIQVYPFSAGVTSGLAAACNVISFAEPGALDVVYVEIPFASRWTEGGEAAKQYVRLYEDLAEQALDEADSQSFIAAIAKEL